METIYVLFDENSGFFYRTVNWGSGRPTKEIKMWKTLAGATKGLAKANKSNLTIKKLSVKDINEE